MLTTNHYWSDSSTATVSSTSNTLRVVGTAEYESDSISISSVQKENSRGKISPQLYFKYIKKKFKTLERMTLDRRLKKLEKAFDKAIEAGQEALGKKVMDQVIVQARESAIYAKGFVNFVERDDLEEWKYKIKGGQISDTKLKDYTRIIPKDVLAKKKKAEPVFDDFVIYHYWNEDMEDVKDMTPEEKDKMRDPVLFGIIKETNRLYFVADWEDEFCDLTFDEIVNVIARGGDRDEMELTKYPSLDYED